MISRSFRPSSARPARTLPALALSAWTLGAVALPVTGVQAQEQLPWGQTERPRVVQPAEQPSGSHGQRDTYAQRDERGSQPYGRDDDDRRDLPPANPSYRPATPVYPPGPSSGPSYDDRSYGDRRATEPERPAERPYDPNRAGDPNRYGDQGRYGDQAPGRPFEPAAPSPYADGPEPRRIPYARGDQSEGRTYSPREIRDAGHRFFGRINEGMANVIEYAFKRGGRPNGYILGEEGGGAFIAGLRYGEGTMFMKNGTQQKVYWQGPSIGYDFGAEGSKTMILVYDLEHPSMIYSTFGGVSGSAYLVGGVGITFMKSDDVVLAPIRSGLGLRLGANVGYLKYTRAPTWNPF